MSKSKLKPPMPKEPIEFAATTKAHLMMDMKRFSNGWLGMVIDRAEIVRGDKNLGSVDLCMGGRVRVTVGKRDWGIDPIDLYLIAKQADDAYNQTIKKQKEKRNAKS